MKNIQEVVLRIHTEIMHQKGINQKSTPDMEIRPKNGITSESIVIFILDLEEELGIELDDYLSQIRKTVFPPPLRTLIPSKERITVLLSLI